MNKKRAKRLVNSGKIGKRLDGLTNNHIPLKLDSNLLRKLIKEERKLRVEASAKSKFRGGKGNRKFVGFVTAGKNTKVRNAGKNRNKKPWRKVKQS